MQRTPRLRPCSKPGVIGAWSLIRDVRPFDTTMMRNTQRIANRLLLVLCSIVCLAHSLLAAEGGFTTETGGVEIVLSNGWERLDQPTNFLFRSADAMLSREL